MGVDGVLEHKAEHVRVDRRHPRPAPVDELDDAERGERAERLAHHRPRDAELGCEGGLGGKRIRDPEPVPSDPLVHGADNAADEAAVVGLRD